MTGPKKPQVDKGKQNRNLLLAIGAVVFAGLLFVQQTATNNPGAFTQAAPSSPAASSGVAPPVAAPGVPGEIGNGTYTIGTEMQAGRWRTRSASSDCYWARLSGFGGGTSEMISNDITGGPAVVDIGPGDKGFTSEHCSPWTQNLLAITSSLDAPIQDGTYLVGTDVSPGTWKAANPADCFWSRLKSFGGGTSGTITNDIGSGIVTISKSDVGFQSSKCGGWIKQ